MKFLNKVFYWIFQITGLYYLYRLIVPSKPDEAPSTLMVRVLSIYLILFGVFYPIYELNISRLENIYGSSIEALGNVENKSIIVQQIGELQSAKIPVEPDFTHPSSFFEYDYYKPIQERSENIVLSYISILPKYEFKNHYMFKEVALRSLEGTLNYSFKGNNDFIFLSIDKCIFNRIEFDKASINKRLTQERNLISTFRIRDNLIKSITFIETTIEGMSLINNEIDFFESQKSIYKNCKFESNTINNFGSITNSIFVGCTFYLPSNIDFELSKFYDCKFICEDCNIEQMEQFSTINKNNSFLNCTLYDDYSMKNFDKGKSNFPDSLEFDYYFN